MKKRLVKLRFPGLFLRFSLLFALLVAGGEGIFSEESNSRVPILRPVVHSEHFGLGTLGQNGYCVFVPTMFYGENPVFIPRLTIRRVTFHDPRIMGAGKTSLQRLAEFLERNNRGISDGRAREIAHIYIQEANKEGVNYDVAFSQMCLETGFLKFGGNVRPGQNNFCGLGVSTTGSRGLSFPSIRIGIRAHIQHLKAYATTARLNDPIVDRRFRFVKRGSIRTIDQLSGRWASDQQYSRKIHSLLDRLYQDQGK